MAIAYDSTGVGFTGAPNASTPFTESHTVVTTGATVYADIAVDRASTLSSVTCAGNAMTLIGTATMTSGSSGDAFVARYKYVGASAGVNTISATSSVAAQVCMDSVAYTGVGSEDTTQTNVGSGSPASESSTCSTGQLILQSLACQRASSQNMSALSPSGGTNRTNLLRVQTAQGLIGLATSDATSNTTFTATATHVGVFAGLAHALIPPADIDPGSASLGAAMGTPAVTAPYVDTPGGATVTSTGGTPTLGASPTVVQPAGASGTLTPGTPAVTAPYVVAPSGATAGASGGTPDIHTGFADVLNKLRNNQSAVVQVLGDSISYGYADTITTPWPHGWVGRFGVLLGQYFGASVSIQSWNDQSTIGGTGLPDAGDSGQFYDAPYSLYTGSGAGTLLMSDGGACSRELTYLDDATRLPILLGTPNIDAIILACGINDWDVDSDTTTTYVAKFKTWLTDIQALCTGVPIIVTNENPVNDSDETHIAGLFTALWTALAGQPLSYSGPASSSYPGVYMLNTRAAYTSSTMVQSTSVHPLASGYTAQALWMAQQLAPEMFLADTPGSATVTATGGTPAVTAPRVDTPGGATGTVTGGTPLVEAPDIVTPSGASGSATGGTPDVDIASASTVVPQPTTVTATPATPVVTAPDTVTPDGASTDAVGGTPQLDLTVHPGGGSTSATGSPPVVTAPDTITPSSAVVAATPSTPVVATGAEAQWDDSTTLLDPSLAPTLSFERPQDPFGNSWTTLGDFPALVELSTPTSGPSFEGVQTTDVTAFTPGGTLFVPRGTTVQAGDRITYQDRKYLLMGARNWDMDHPMTGVDMGWMTFALQTDPRQLISDLLALRGQQITLVPIVATAGAGGGNDYSDGTPRDPQLFVLTNTKGLDGREDSQTDRGVSRKFQFELVGAASSLIALGDKWEDDVAKYTVESVDRTKFYNVEALVTGFLKVTGHSFG